VISGPGVLDEARSLAAWDALVFFVLTTLSSGLLALGQPLVTAFEIGLACAFAVACVTALAGFIHLAERIPYERILRARVGAGLTAAWGVEPSVVWTAKLLEPSRASGGVYLGRDLRFVSHERKVGVSLVEDVLVSIPLAEIAAVETGQPRSWREWLVAGSETVEIVCTHGKTVRLGTIAPRALASAIRGALDPNLNNNHEAIGLVESQSEPRREG
jgi:hypothetical protein